MEAEIPVMRPPGEFVVIIETTEISGDPRHPDLVEVRFNRSGVDGARPVSVAVRSEAGLLQTDIRSVAWKNWINWAGIYLRHMRRASPRQRTFVLRDISADLAAPQANTPPPRKRPGRAGHPNAFYEEVAEEYRTLVLGGASNPTKVIADRRHYSRNTVAGWVRECRRRGMLPAARSGRAG